MSSTLHQRGFSLLVVSIGLAVGLTGCPPGEQPGQTNQASTNQYEPDASVDDVESDAEQDTAPHIDEEVLRADVRERLEVYGVEPLEPPPEQDPDKVELGHNLFFEPLLSGPKDASCAFCHPVDHATADPNPLPAGTGATIDEHGDRVPGPDLRYLPRRSPDLFNRGHEEMETFFWDSRMKSFEEDGADMFVVFDRSYPKLETSYWRVMSRFEELDNFLAGMSMLPVLDRVEMRGETGSVDIYGETNELAQVADFYPEGVWNKLMERLLEVPEYREMFEAIYPETDLDDLSFAHAANGLAAFFIEEFSFNDTPFDQFVAGDDEALSYEQLRGADLFYGEANCASCHGGTLLTDQEIYNYAAPPMTRGPDPLDNMDLGAAHRAHAGPDEAFAFRTPPLRNVAITPPYLHNGVYDTLEDTIRHKIDPVESMWDYDGDHLGPAFRLRLHTSEESLSRVEETVSPKAFIVPELTDDEIDYLVAFLESLTSPSARDLEHLQLESTPSGIPIPDPQNPPAFQAEQEE